jgi:hypothetical protein
VLSNEDLESIRRSLAMATTLPADQALLNEVIRLRRELARAIVGGGLPAEIPGED